MKTKEQIKHDYEQNHFRKQRELIDAGELNYWKLPKSNKEGIVAQCKGEAEKYPELEWELTSSIDDSTPVFCRSSNTSFNYIYIYYRRIDPLPTKGITINFEKAMDAKDEQIKALERKLANYDNNAEVNIERIEAHSKKILDLKKEIEKLQETIENKDIIIEDYQVSEASLYRDIRTLAMRQL